MIKKGNCKLNVFGIKQVFGGIKGRLFRSNVNRENKTTLKNNWQNVYTMEEAIEQARFGLFQIRLLGLMGFAKVK